MSFFMTGMDRKNALQNTFHVHTGMLVTGNNARQASLREEPRFERPAGKKVDKKIKKVFAFLKFVIILRVDFD